MIDPHFVFLGALFSLTGSARYAIRTLLGRVTPNRVSFFLWASASFIGFFAQLAEGVGLPAVLILASGLGPALVFFASFAGKSAPWRVSRFDLGCGAMAVVALVVWQTLDNPTLAVLFAVSANVIGGIPTILKAWRAPWTEEPLFYAFGAVNGTITLLTIRQWDVAAWAFPVYLTTICIGMLLIMQIRGRLLKREGGAEAERSGRVRGL